ncbi:MAG: ABC transporter permease [Candidatus Sericytochromatia bacterium]|uniref:ABC transporter permease n=1 Tax=Candidatus Tanganyikabacteria bacterium TaxID=2961651 RepID=A0A937X8P7_9BACT|nr:ABC transporter permease [Candidatus Tanganyikabacteria bacterium]
MSAAVLRSRVRGPLAFALRLANPLAPPEAAETFRQFRTACLATVIPVVLVSSVIGATATLMGYHAFLALGTQAMIGAYAGLVALRELAPLLAGAMIAAKPGTALTAAIAAMRGSEQIDALEMMGVDPYRYLLGPRVVALILAAPALLVFADVSALAASYGTAVITLEVAPGTFLADLTRFVGVREIWCGLAKAVTFAALSGMIAAYQGFKAESGPRGVSAAVTRGMVISTMAIVVANFLLSEAFFR